MSNHSSHSTKAPSEERFISYSESGHRDRERDREKDPGEKKERKAFWSRDKEREKEREKDKDKDNKERYVERGKERGRDRERREDEHPAELTKMIGRTLISRIHIFPTHAQYRVSNCNSC